MALPHSLSIGLNAGDEMYAGKPLLGRGQKAPGGNNDSNPPKKERVAESFLAPTRHTQSCPAALGTPQRTHLALFCALLSALAGSL